MHYTTKVNQPFVALNVFYRTMKIINHCYFQMF